MKVKIDVPRYQYICENCRRDIHGGTLVHTEPTQCMGGTYSMTFCSNECRQVWRETHPWE